MTEFSTIRCSYFPECSGCAFQDRVDHPPLWGAIKIFFIPHTPITLHVGSLIGWRTRSKLAVRGTALKPKIGLFHQGTHTVVSIPDCPLHNPAINRAYQSVYAEMVRFKIEPYDEIKRLGMVRYVQFAVQRSNEKIQLAVVIYRKGPDPQVDKFVKALYATGQFSGIWINFQHEATNRIFGEQWMLAEGEPYLWEKMGKAHLCLHPACFVQAHLELFEKILSNICENLYGGRVVEFYAGVGSIGFNCVEKASQVICTEINPYAEECFHHSRLKMPLELQQKISFILGDAGTLTSLLAEADTVIVDPPRKGLDPLLLEALCRPSEVKQLIYLSCGFYSFQKECEQLLAHGWTIERAEAYLLFPGSDHVEVLCFFKR